MGKEAEEAYNKAKDTTGDVVTLGNRKKLDDFVKGVEKESKVGWDAITGETQRRKEQEAKDASKEQQRKLNQMNKLQEEKARVSKETEAKLLQGRTSTIQGGSTGSNDMLFKKKLLGG